MFIDCFIELYYDHMIFIYKLNIENIIEYENMNNMMKKRQII